MKKLFLFHLLFCLSSQLVFSQSKLELAKNTLLNDPELANASVGLYVIDLATGTKLVENNANYTLPPASTVKLFATASAIEMLGANYQPVTRMYGTKPISSAGIIEGDLFIRGGGDISLGSKFYNQDGKESEFIVKWVDSLYSLGLRSITGNIIGDGSEFGYKGAPDGWNWADMGNYYGAGPSGLPIYDNMLRYYFKVAGSVGSTAELIKTFPFVDGLQFKSYIYGRKGGGDNSYIYGAPYSLDRFGTGYLPVKSNPFVVKSSLPDPELQFAVEFYNALVAKGIRVSGKPKAARKENLPSASVRYANGHHLLYTHKGAKVSSIAYWTNMKSVNVFAEQLVCWVGYKSVGDGSTETGLRKLSGYWNSRINTRGLFLTDGSGLSRSNAISPTHFCELLRYMHTSTNSKAFKETLPIAGVSGTLSSVCYKQAAHGKIRAKSGTMKRIKAYAGYAETNSGKQLAFAIILNNYSCTSEGALAKIEKVMNAMVAD
jgi:D-alanyl-D-alanine carboxypeptidase/D-alanyl-D-alanine-endopeptidase (penicillin-binding protein 4)